MRFALVLATVLFVFWGCTQQTESPNTENPAEASTSSTRRLSEVEIYFDQHYQDSLPGISVGTVNNGSLKNSTVVPFEGPNFIYFDTNSYLGGRAHTRPDVSSTIQMAYAEMKGISERLFVIMELSLPEGGEILPHRTHQNGLSVDFMSPLLKDGKPYTDLDLEGAPHYLLDFDDQGRWTEDPSVSIDFDVVAMHILALQQAAKKNKLKISKVIWKMELRDDLLATPHGMELANAGIYITRNLSPLINRLHDDHYHVDFEVVP